MAIEPRYLSYRYYYYDVLLLGFTPLFPIHETLHQVLKHSATLVQPVLELTGVRCLTIPPGQLHNISPSLTYVCQIFPPPPTAVLEFFIEMKYLQ